MTARILDGRALAAELRSEIAARAERLRARGCAPRLAVVIAGDDAANLGYARGIQRAGPGCGVDVQIDTLPSAATAEQLAARLRALGADPLVHGVILQQPLPGGIDARAVAEHVPVAKDVDCANPVNLGRLTSARENGFVPATPLACMLLLERASRRSLRGARACVVGRSTVVGLPAALLLIARDATVTVVHRQTADLAHHTRDADVLLVAAGAPGLIGASHVAPGATVIDVGTTYTGASPAGDVAFDDVAAVAGEITPVPGGVGPVTTVALLGNVVLAAERALDAGSAARP